jgi:hypothetical protein
MNFLLIISEWSGKVVCENGKCVFDFFLPNPPSSPAVVNKSTYSDRAPTGFQRSNAMEN